MKNSSYYIAPVGDWTHDLPHTVASNMVKVSHALNHSATEAEVYTFSLVSWLIPRRSHTFFLSLPNAELALESLLLTSTSMLASLERVLQM